MTVPPRVIRWVVYVARIRQRKKRYNILVGKPECKTPLGRPKRRREVNNIRTDLREIGWEGVNWLFVA